ncbi:glycerol acyltransferase [Deltaproteobacteria bacterium Smac51]|nr:glycerol acyltransferase [Deltaproteobacteria bacterium Smac51]
MAEVDYPVPGFRFNVTFSGSSGSFDMGFMEVSGLEMKLETETVVEGGEYVYAYQLPKRLAAPSLTLKRGLTVDSNLELWVRDALEDFTFEPLLVTVSLLNEDGNPLMSWQAYQAWPKSWSLGSLNAREDQIVIETLTLAYAHLRRLP